LSTANGFDPDYDFQNAEILLRSPQRILGFRQSFVGNKKNLAPHYSSARLADDIAETSEPAHLSGILIAPRPSPGVV
jgi:hypothetical protein